MTLNKHENLNKIIHPIFKKYKKFLIGMICRLALHGKKIKIERSAFTLLELIFSIIVVGILASLLSPNIQPGSRLEAKHSILSAIRYTRQLALKDNKCDSSPEWQINLWQIRFSKQNNMWSYTIASNSKNGVLSKINSAIDPANGLRIYSNSQSGKNPNVQISEKYGISDITFSGCSSGGAAHIGDQRHIAFDRFGRVFRSIDYAKNDYGKYVNSDCNITFAFNNELNKKDFSVIIKKETGFAYIAND